MQSAEKTTQVTVERHELVSGATFDTVLDAVLAGLGRPDFPEFQKRIEWLKSWPEFHDAVEAEAGSAGLMVFLQLDVGSVLELNPEEPSYKSVRIIAGNPVTMSGMAGTTPEAASFAPVTILVYEATDGVHLVYDTMVSNVPELTGRAADTAHTLDAEVLHLLRTAAG
jgi:uncharacterized protein (DUF302 family)